MMRVLGRQANAYREILAPYRLHILATLLAVLWLATGGAARAQDAAAAENNEGTPKAEAKVYALLDEAITRAQTLRLPENRIRFRTIAACLLWSHDESRARALLKESMTELAALVGRADGAMQANNQAQAYTVLRFELVRLIAARDAKLALEFLRATRQPRTATRYALTTRPPDQELALELTLAGELTAKDVSEAARIAEESLSNGPTAELLSVLSKLGAVDPEAATKLATDTIKRLQAEDLASDGAAVVVAVNLVNMTRVASSVPRANPDPANSAARPRAYTSITVDEQTRRDLINALVAGVVRVPAGRMNTAHLLFNNLSAIMPEIERYAPGQLLAVRAKAAEYGRTLDPATKAWQKYESLRQQGSAEALLEAAGTAPPEIGDELYAEAALKLVDGDDAERARQIVNNISDPQRRALNSRLIEQQLLARALLRGKLEDAGQRLLPDAPLEDRVAMLLYLSNLAARQQQPAIARRFLSEALGLVGGRVQNGFQFTSQLHIVRAFAAVEPKQSFVLLDGLADQLNDLLTAAAAVDGFGPDCFKDGELKPFVGNMWGEMVKQFGEELAAVAPQDIERALAVAQKFQRDEVRVFISLRLAARVLADAEAQAGNRQSLGAQ